MGKKSKAGKEFSSGGLLLFMYKNRVPLISISIVAFIVSVIVSLLITDRYRSTVVIYPAVSKDLTRPLMSSAGYRGEKVGFGEEDDTERLLQVLKSDAIRESMVEKYSLMEHYGIKDKSRYPYTALNKKFNRNVSVRKTEYMAIEIEVLDADPVIAAAMANDIASYVDSVMNNMLRVTARQSLALIQEEYNRNKLEVKILEDSLKRIREFGIIDYESQAEVLNNAYATAILNKDTASMNYFRERIRALSVWGGVYVSLRDHLVNQNTKLSDLKSSYEEIRLNAEKTISHKFVVMEAKEAEKKSYPVRSVIVMVSTISAFLFTLFALVLMDALKRVTLVPDNRSGKEYRKTA
jgi:capsular polysaccharide biosynthesis protein